jgi:DNA-binding transcriptional LysR family regulator
MKSRASAGLAMRCVWAVSSDTPSLPEHRAADIDILAIYPSRRHLSAKVRVMVDFLAEAFRGTPPWD